MTKSTADSTEAAAPPLPSPKERRRLREAKALSEEQAAEALGVTRATIRSWETGRSDPRGRKREAYAKLLAACTAELSCREPSPEEDGGARPAEAPRGGGERSASPSPPPVRRHGGGRRPERAERNADTAGREPRGTTAGSPATGGSAGEGSTAGGPPTTSVGPGGYPAAGETATGLAKSVPARPGDTAPPPPVEAPRPYPGTSAARGSEECPEAPAAGHTAPGTREAAAARPSGPSERPPARDGATPTAEQAFDELYARTAVGLARQTLLLTGRRALSQEAVERAFHLAWQRWPEVAVDRDPPGWVRAAAYEYAMSPWHRLRRAHRRPDPVASARPASAAYPGGRTLREALLALPPSYRRTLLLYDGLGLDLPDTAAETEASTPAAANRLLHARAAVAEQIPELAAPEALQHELSDLVANIPAPKIAPARSVRGGSERRAELWTRAAIGLTVLILGAAAVTMAVTEDHYEPPQAPGERVGGVPPRNGPEPYSKEDYRLRVQLHSHPGAGPARLAPLAR
ncbi:sigma factor-like helix-turn-helix DNA-binding protein [Streptomyces wuyuanensis]|uniref:sigma factor-like helix-turn-helix DNA-binding protein n=1 Tax=Streptomyces wuyuanensis TaxID=1196353 RepID=UPI003D717C6F